jgi:hypothetical protein
LLKDAAGILKTDREVMRPWQWVATELGSTRTIGDHGQMGSVGQRSETDSPATVTVAISAWRARSEDREGTRIGVGQIA